MAENPTTSPKFETLLEDLQQVVKGLESGQWTLEQSLAGYERGVGLLKAAQAALQQAEQRIQILTREAAP